MSFNTVISRKQIAGHLIVPEMCCVPAS